MFLKSQAFILKILVLITFLLFFNKILCQLPCSISVKSDKFDGLIYAFCHICHQKLYIIVTICIILLSQMQPGLWNLNTVIRNRISTPPGHFFRAPQGSFPPPGKSRLQKTEEPPRSRPFHCLGGVADCYNFRRNKRWSFFIIYD